MARRPPKQKISEETRRKLSAAGKKGAEKVWGDKHRGIEEGDADFEDVGPEDEEAVGHSVRERGRRGHATSDETHERLRRAGKKGAVGRWGRDEAHGRYDPDEDVEGGDGGEGYLRPESERFREARRLGRQKARTGRGGTPRKKMRYEEEEEEEEPEAEEVY